MTIYGETIHPMHPCQVLKLKQEETPYTCDGCGEVGLGFRYTCGKKTCNFHLHKVCATPEVSITHPFFRGCTFRFLQSGGPDRVCDACGRGIKGFVYRSLDNKWDLHPTCANLPTVRNLAEGVDFVLHNKSSSKCYLCSKKRLWEGAKTWSYVSRCKQYHLHVACVTNMLLQNWEKQHLGDGKREVGAGTKDGTVALVSTEPKLQIVLEKKRSKSDKFAKFKKILKFAISFIMAVLVGDPTAMLAGVILSLSGH